MIPYRNRWNLCPDRLERRSGQGGYFQRNIHIRQWQNSLINDPENYTPTYLKSINNQLSAIFNFGRKYYGLNQNPVANAGSFGRKKAETMQFWTPEEFKSFIEAISDNRESLIAFQVLFWTGMRSGELLALTAQDILLQDHSIRINKNYARLNGEDLILPTKTPKSNRVVTIPLWLTEALMKFLKETGRDKGKGRLFTLNKYYLTREVQRGCTKSGVKRIRVHDIRHPYVKATPKNIFSFFRCACPKCYSRSCIPQT